MITAAFNGKPGAYAEKACRKYFGEDVETIPCVPLNEVFRRVASGQVKYGMIPIENSIGGRVGAPDPEDEFYLPKKPVPEELIWKHKVWIHGEVILPIHHCFLGNAGATPNTVKKVYSHPQALKQCSAFLNRYEREYENDTATAAARVREEGGLEVAAIASREAAQGLQVIATDIANNSINETRFWIVSRTPSFTGNKVSLAFRIEDSPGAMQEALAPWNYLAPNVTPIVIQDRKAFCLDMLGNATEDQVRQSLVEMGKRTSEFRFFGCYERAS